MRAFLGIVRLALALAAMIVVWRMAYRDGVRDGERGLGYWAGWQDAMTATEYGKKPYNSEERN